MLSNIFCHTNNPANIKANNSFRGALYNKTYKGFQCFSSVDDGIRALMVLLLTYGNKYKLFTVGDILRRFCPSEKELVGYFKYLEQIGFSETVNPFATPYIFAFFCSLICSFETYFILHIETYESLFKQFGFELPVCISK